MSEKIEDQKDTRSGQNGKVISFLPPSDKTFVFPEQEEKFSIEVKTRKTDMKQNRRRTSKKGKIEKEK